MERGETSSPLSTKGSAKSYATRLPHMEIPEMSIICGTQQETMDEVDRVNEEEVAIRCRYCELTVFPIYRVSRNFIGTQVLGRVYLVGIC